MVSIYVEMGLEEKEVEEEQATEEKEEKLCPELRICISVLKSTEFQRRRLAAFGRHYH